MTPIVPAEIRPTPGLLRSVAASPRLSFLARNLYQVVGATIVAVLLPALVWWNTGFITRPNPFATNTVIGTLVAVLLGAYILRRMSSYPGVQAISFVLPTHTTVYAAVILAFFFLRLDYSRYQFLASFTLTIVWFYFVLLVENRTNRPKLALLPFGHVDALRRLGSVDWLVVQSAEDIPEVAGVVADLRADLPAEWQKFLANCALKGIPVYHLKQISESLTGSVQIEHLSENTLGSLLPSSVYFRLKRGIDLFGVLIVAPFALVVGAVAAAAILIADGRPILFRQERMGFRGEVFTMLKFRTMRNDSCDGQHYTEVDDPRITPIGRFMRRWRIDELPQILHILTGEMSWIGPRPEALPLSEWYESRIPFYSYRHIVRPGISGWAQVNQGNVAMLEAATGKLHYDFFYIKHFSPWLDLLIAARTVRTILTGFGSR